MIHLRHLYSARQLTPEVLEEIFAVSRYMQRVCVMKGRTDLLSDKIVGLLFLEPSSRTMLSFQSAAQRLGAGILFMQGKDLSSFEKGESIEDTMRVVSGYCDIIAARLHDEGAAEKASKASVVPFINGGDGGNEHPTQALIDTYTIVQRLGEISGKTYAFGFDPLQSRSIHSLSLVLAQYPDVKMIFISPKELQATPELLQELSQRGVDVVETQDIAAVQDADVIYLNRLQQERFENKDVFEKYRREYQLTPSLISDRNRLILDPLPRIDEISTEIDALPIAAYFEQADNGVPVRMALLAELLQRV